MMEMETRTMRMTMTMTMTMTMMGFAGQLQRSEQVAEASAHPWDEGFIL